MIIQESFRRRHLGVYIQCGQKDIITTDGCIHLLDSKFKFSPISQLKRVSHYHNGMFISHNISCWFYLCLFWTTQGTTFSHRIESNRVNDRNELPKTTNNSSVAHHCRCHMQKSNRHQQHYIVDSIVVEHTTGQVDRQKHQANCRKHFRRWLLRNAMFEQFHTLPIMFAWNKPISPTESAHKHTHKVAQSTFAYPNLFGNMDWVKLINWF